MLLKLNLASSEYENDYIVVYLNKKPIKAALDRLLKYLEKKV
jgi:hypothetical protein